MNRIRLGIVGCGSITQRGLLPHLALEDAREVFETVAVCDVVPERARAMAEQYGVPKWYAGIDDLLAHADIDAVLIASPIPFHFEQAMKAVEAGKHVHLQKTMTVSLQEANILVEAAKAKGVKLVASPGQMMGAGSQILRDRVRAGALGRVYWAVASTAWIGHEYEPFRDGSPVDPTWYYKPGGGPMLDMAVYTLHTLTGILGPVRRIAAMSEIGLATRCWNEKQIKVEMDDNTLLLLHFDQGFAAVGGHFCQTGAVLGWGFTGIYGSEATVEITDYVPGTTYPAEIKVNPPELAERLNWPASGAEGPAAPYLTGVHAQMDEAHLWVDVRHLADCILDDTEPVPSGEHARHVIEILEKGYFAARTGTTQELTTAF